MNLSTVLQLGNLWASKPIIDFANQLLPSSGNANAGGMVGNKMFYANDYMVGHTERSGRLEISHPSV